MVYGLGWEKWRRRRYWQLVAVHKLRHLGTRAFTVVEILLVLALFGIVAGLFVYNFDSFKETFFENRTPESLLATAIKKARFYASNRHETCVLLFESENNCLKIQTLMGPVIETFSLPNKDKYSAKPGIVFFDAQEKDSMEFAWIPNHECKHLLFDPNGLSSHVFVKIQDNGETRSYRLDAFSGQLLATKL